VGDADAVLARLRTMANPATLAGYARYAIPTVGALGVSVGELRALAKELGRSHALDEGLWGTGVYEARMLAAFVDEPARVTPAQMDRWMGEVVDWAVCDTLCFHLFDRTPHAWARVEAWAERPEEFVKRGAFALLASLAGHDRKAPDDSFLRLLPLIERAAGDERNFVKKGVSWALRGVGQRSPALHAAAVALAERLAAAPKGAARWVGKDALRDLTRPMVVARAAKRGGAQPP
jgi:3-methyladenine DNA glycosylase AlkD